MKPKEKTVSLTHHGKKIDHAMACVRERSNEMCSLHRTDVGDVGHLVWKKYDFSRTSNKV
jgi:hypothetical protein